MATISLNTPAAQDARIAAAIGDAHGFTVPGTNTPRSATGPEIKQDILDYLINLVRVYERKQAHAVVAEPTPITPT